MFRYAFSLSSDTDSGSNKIPVSVTYLANLIYSSNINTSSLVIKNTPPINKKTLLIIFKESLIFSKNISQIPFK